jgi:tetratricopeptide (TPR) repeat protein
MLPKSSILLGRIIPIWRSRRGLIGIPSVLCLLVSLVSICAKAQSSPANFEDLANNAAAAREKNDIPHAIELYEQITKLDPHWPDAWWYLGSLQYQEGTYAEGRDALSHYIALTPNAAPAFAVRGLCEFETGEYDQSLNDIEHGLALGAANQPRNEKILRYHEALLQTRTGKFEDALRTYALFAADPPTPELLLSVGLAGLRIPLLPKEVTPDQQDLLSAAGKAALDFMKGEKEVAQNEFQQLFQRFPTAANAHYLYGYLLYPTDAGQGIVQFQQELEVAPSNVTAKAVLAWVLVLQNRDAEALPYAEKAVAQDPNLPTAQLVLGRALTDTGDAKSGIKHLEKVLMLQPNNLEVHLALAKAYSESGRKEDARRERLLCLEMTKNDTSTVHP